MDQVLICLKKNRAISIDVLHSRQKELVALGNAIKNGCKKEIAICIKKALNAGATKNDILKVVAFIIGNERLFSSIFELIRTLNYEENKRVEYISILNDVRE